MKKVLIISYFYPPANFAGCERTASWAKYFIEFGYYPIILTRQWNHGQTDLTDNVEKNTLVVDYLQTHEVHRLPFKSSLRDRCAQYPWLKPIQKALTLTELVFSNFFISALPYSNFLTYSKSLLKKDSEIKIVIASGRPFQTFFIGSRLKKTFPALVWLPDYRDEWTTHSKAEKSGVLKKILFFLDQRSEKKWTSNADAFITVSNHLVENISALIKKRGVSILNGFEAQQELPSEAKCKTPCETVTFSYLGTVYPYQPMNELIDSFKKIIDQNTSKKEIKIRFYGVEAMPSEKEKMLKACAGYEDYFIFIDRLPKESLQSIYASTDFLFLTNYVDIQNWLVVKLFDYSVSGRPMLLYPTDNGAMENFIQETNVGYSFRQADHFVDFILGYLHSDSPEPLSIQINKTQLSHYSRKNQAQILCEELNHFHPN